MVIQQEHEILLHFDTSSNVLSLDDFINTGRYLQSVGNNVISLFLKNSKYDIFVLPPEIGSFKAVFKSVLIGFLLGAIPEFTSGFIKGLTGKSISEYGENIGQLSKDLIEKIFSTPNTDLRIPNNLDLDRALKAKSNFYTMCYKSKIINGVSFNNYSNYIPKNSFINYISEDIVRPLSDKYELRELTIVKPIIVPSENQWQFKDDTDKIINAEMKDENFIKGILSGNLPLKSSSKDDKVIVMIKYKRQKINGEEKIVSKTIEKIYRFNEIEFAPLPENMETVVSQNDDSLNLFEL